MKVAFMFGGMNRGGAETLMLDVFQNCQNAGFEMIGIHRKGGVCRDAFYQTRSPLFYISPKKHLYISYFMRLRRCIKQNGVDIIHTQHWLDCIYAKVATVGLNVKVINTFHGFYKLTGIEGRLCCLSMRWSDAICFVSDYEKKWYQEKCPWIVQKSYVIYNGIDFRKFISETKLESPLPISSANDGSWPKLVMVGSFGRGRTQNVISKAIALLKKDGICRFEFYFVGARIKQYGNLYNECEAYSKKQNLMNVHFLGAREDVPAILNQVDGFVYSTKHDTFGIAVVEAMAAGLPVVVNDWAVMKEITKDGQWATLFKTEDVEDCANKIKELLDNIVARKAQSLQIAKEVRAEYSIEKHVQRLSEIYKLLKK